jgi:hypothetical protein
MVLETPVAGAGSPGRMLMVAEVASLHALNMFRSFFLPCDHPEQLRPSRERDLILYGVLWAAFQYQTGSKVPFR